MGSMAAIQAVVWLLGSMTLAAKPVPAPLPLVDRPAVSAAGLTIYWDRSVTLQKDEQTDRMTRLGANLYVLTNKGRVITVDAATGVQRWTRTLADPGIRIAGPSDGPGKVYFTTIEGIQSYDPATGKSYGNWRGKFAATTPVAADGEMLYTGNADSRVAAVRLKDMETLWQFMTDGLVTSAPILVGSNLFAVSEGGKIYAAEKKDKDQLWPIQDLNSPVKAAPAVYGQSLFVGTAHQSLFCYDLATGQRRWQARLPGPLYIQPKVTSRALYQPIEAFGVFCIDPANGHVRWTAAEGEDLLAEQGDIVWLMSNQAAMIGVDPKDGHIRREVPCMAEMWVSNQTDDAIFLGSGRGQLMCVRPRGAGFLQYRTMLESAAGLTTQPADGAASLEPVPPSASRQPVDRLQGSGATPPISGSTSKAPADQPE